MITLMLRGTLRLFLMEMMKKYQAGNLTLQIMNKP